MQIRDRTHTIHIVGELFAECLPSNSKRSSADPLRDSVEFVQQYTALCIGTDNLSGRVCATARSPFMCHLRRIRNFRKLDWRGIGRAVQLNLKGCELGRSRVIGWFLCRVRKGADVDVCCQLCCWSSSFFDICMYKYIIRIVNECD